MRGSMDLWESSHTCGFHRALISAHARVRVRVCKAL